MIAFALACLAVYALGWVGGELARRAWREREERRLQRWWEDGKWL